MIKTVNQQARVSNQPKVQRGFTLLELIVTIIIIGILAVTILPRFSGTDGYEEYTYRSQAIAILRNVQIRAMQQGSTGCYQILVNASNLGIPDNSPCTPSASFSSSFGDSDDIVTRNRELAIESNHSVTFALNSNSKLPFIISFDKMGRPEGDCLTGADRGCIINVTGEETLQIKIESEGYIHAI